MSEPLGGVAAITDATRVTRDNMVQVPCIHCDEF
jgi:hypothetical protein